MPSLQKQCCTDDGLGAYANGTHTRPENVEGHVERCPSCAKRLHVLANRIFTQAESDRFRCMRRTHDLLVKAGECKAPEVLAVATDSTVRRHALASMLDRVWLLGKGKYIKYVRPRAEWNIGGKRAGVADAPDELEEVMKEEAGQNPASTDVQEGSASGGWEEELHDSDSHAASAPAAAEGPQCCGGGCLPCVHDGALADNVAAAGSAATAKEGPPITN